MLAKSLAASGEVSIPKRASEALNRAYHSQCPFCAYVSIPKRASEALNRCF